jgi:AbrB family looped-hinge helix DNA binding protein
MPEDGTTFTTKVMKLGRVTIPEPVRDLLNIEPGDIVEMRVQKKTPVRD